MATQKSENVFSLKTLLKTATSYDWHLLLSAVFQCWFSILFQQSHRCQNWLDPVGRLLYHTLYMEHLPGLLWSPCSTHIWSMGTSSAEQPETPTLSVKKTDLLWNSELWWYVSHLVKLSSHSQMNCPREVAFTNDTTKQVINEILVTCLF